MSSGEAEYYAAVKGAAEGMALQSMLGDVGVEVRVRVHTDSTACKGICNRRGIGRIRHMAVPFLWLQDKVGKGELSLVKVPGCENPSDLMTKHLSGPDLKKCLNRLCFMYEDGRSSVIDGGGSCGANSGDLSAIAVRPRGSVGRRPVYMFGSTLLV
jgi:hypothetical protein